MSLQVWLPLTKGLRNQGLSNMTITNHGATFNSAGKLGGCYLFDGSNDYMIGTYNATAEISFAAWINMPTLPGRKHIFDARTSGGTGYQPIYLTNTSIQVGCSGSGSGYPYFNYTWVANTWYHICVTHNTTEVKCYINGVLIGSSTTGKGVALGTCNFTLGSRCNQSNYSNVKINDVRIYNHCLSPMEVKELSKGLVLHYPLNRQGWGQENLILNSNTFAVGSGATGITSSTTAEGYHQVVAASGNSNWHASWATSTATSLLENTFAEGDPFTISFTIKSENANVTRPPNIYVKSGMGYYTMQGEVTSEWSTIYYSGTWKDTNAIAFHLGFSGLVGTYLFKNWKVEKGSIPTPWCPNSADTLADTMGLNSDIEYDISGYCNNGTRTGTFSWTSDTPKYNVSQVFASGNNYIDCGASQEILPTDGLTVSLWINYSTWGNPISCTEGGGWNFENSSGIQFPVYVAGVGYKVANSGVATSTLQNGWHMLTGTFDKTNVKIYIDGVLKATTATGSTNGIGYAANHCYVGAEAAGSTSIATAALVGKLSDVRIYATALSADDILSLYQEKHINKFEYNGYTYLFKDDTSGYTTAIGTITDIQVGGTSVVSNGVANVTTASIINLLYPIGSYYETSNGSFNPSSAGWPGTWELETYGYTHISAGSTYTLGSINNASSIDYAPTGVVKGKALDNASYWPTHTHGSGGLSHTYYLGSWGTNASTRYNLGGSNTAVSGSGYRMRVTSGPTITNGWWSQTFDQTHQHTGTTNIGVASPAAHSHGTAISGSTSKSVTGTTTNISKFQPVIVVNRWHRTA